MIIDERQKRLIGMMIDSFTCAYDAVLGNISEEEVDELKGLLTERPVKHQITLSDGETYEIVADEMRSWHGSLEIVRDYHTIKVLAPGTWLEITRL